ncbi:MAG: M56 family metallopeptidase [Muribaculaceae bacterium]|nr:M56 family metallopeptidase [Muribaculaceae bacterium]
MGALFSYSFAISLILVLLFPVLHQTVNRSISFSFNRVILLIGILLSLILPAVFLSLIPTFSPYTLTVLTEAPNHNEYIHSALSAPSSSDNLSWKRIAVIAYFIGITIILSRESLSYYRLSRLIAKSNKIVHKNYTLCISYLDNITPFSWGRYLFLPSSDTSAPNDNILLHEQTHISLRHWLDILFADLFCTLLWYNPAAWQTRRLIKLNHEFEADRAVIRSGADTLQYQRLLITEAIGRRNLPHVNSFTDGKNNFRKRILVMSKPHSSVNHLWITAFTLPAVISAGLIISTPSYARFLSSLSDIKLIHSVNTSAYPSQSYHSENNIFPSEQTVSEAKPSIIKKLPSPLNDKTGLTELITEALSGIEINNSDELNTIIQIVIDKDGKVKNIAVSDTDDLTIKIRIEEAAKQICFEKTFIDGNAIEMHYIIPVKIKTAS